MGLEEALEHLGKYGKWQFMTYTLLCLFFSISTSWQLFAIVFIGVINNHHCKVNSTLHLNQSVPFKMGADGLMRAASCKMYTDSFMNATRSCTDGYTYDLMGFEEKGTMTMEWDLVCDKDGYVETSQTVFNLGSMLGSFICTPFADLIGRKKLFFICQFLMSVFGISMSFSPNYYVFCTFQFLTGLFAMGLMMAGFVIACELFNTKLRAAIAPATYFFVSIGMMSLTIWAYFLRHWRTLQLAISIPPLATLIYYFWCPESLRWLVASDRKNEALLILKNAAKFNKVIMPDDILEGDAREEDAILPEHRPTMRRLFKNSKTRRYCLIMLYLCFTNFMMYYGVSLLTSVLAGDRYLNFFIVSVIEIPATLMAILTLARFGRRVPLCCFHIFAGVAMAFCAIFASIPGLSAHTRGLVVTAFAIISKFGISAAWSIELIYAMEIFPTLIRSTGLGLVAGAGGVGSTLAPYAAYLFRLQMWIPGAVFAVMSTVAGLLTLLEPETLGRPLPLTVEEIASWPLAMSAEEKDALRQPSSVEEKANQKQHEMRPNLPPSYKSVVSLTGQTNAAFQEDRHEIAQNDINNYTFHPASGMGAGREKMGSDNPALDVCDL